MKRIFRTKHLCEHPFNGFFTLDSNGKRTSVFIYQKGNKCLHINYSRYLMCIKVGRILEAYEHVHHKDEDKTNDSIDNLEIILDVDHYKIHHEGYGSMETKCHGCGIDFEIDIADYNDRIKRTNNLYCSLLCFHKSRTISNKKYFRKININFPLSNKINNTTN